MEEDGKKRNGEKTRFYPTPHLYHSRSPTQNKVLSASAVDADGEMVHTGPSVSSSISLNNMGNHC